MAIEERGRLWTVAPAPTFALMEEKAMTNIRKAIPKGKARRNPAAREKRTKLRDNAKSGNAKIHENTDIRSAEFFDGLKMIVENLKIVDYRLNILESYKNNIEQLQYKIEMIDLTVKNVVVSIDSVKEFIGFV
jgi:hypothetical protein